jgi:hypothetical protein
MEHWKITEVDKNVFLLHDPAGRLRLSVNISDENKDEILRTILQALDSKGEQLL